MPEYDNHHLGYEQDWIAANRTVLHIRCSDAALGAPLPEADFDIFCRAQHEAQLTLRDNYRNTLRQY